MGIISAGITYFVLLSYNHIEINFTTPLRYFELFISMLISVCLLNEKIAFNTLLITGLLLLLDFVMLYLLPRSSG